MKRKKIENWIKTTQIKGSGINKEEIINLEINLAKN
jgi:hypothetical protein